MLLSKLIWPKIGYDIDKYPLMQENKHPTSRGMIVRINFASTDMASSICQGLAMHVQADDRDDRVEAGCKQHKTRIVQIQICEEDVACIFMRHQRRGLKYWSRGSQIMVSL